MRSLVEETARRDILAVNHNGLVIYKPREIDKKMAQAIVFQFFGLVKRMRVLEATDSIILINLYPYTRKRVAPDPVVPVILHKTNWKFQFAFKRFVMTVARFVELYEIGAENNTWYKLSVNFWAKMMFRNLPHQLTKEERDYVYFHVLETMANPRRTR